MKLRRATVALALAALLHSPQGWAVASCSASAQLTAFGSYNPFNASAINSTGDVGVSCSLVGLISLLVAYNIKLSTGGSASYAPRRMSSGASTLSYNLYTTNARTTVWGDGTSSTGTISDGYLLGLGTTTQHYTVYARLPALQNVRAGSYLDTITVTVDY